MKKSSAHKLALAITASILAAGGAQAYDLTFGTNLPPVTVHGFASQGFLYSSDYNYLAPDTKNGSFQFSEFGLNVSMNPFPRTRIAVQGFDFDVGDVGQYDPFLDYALIEYTFNDEVGLRAGRIRRPAGIYNAIQDIDLARTYVLLPQGMYDARWRDWSAGLDGGEVFGSIPLSKAGSASYEAYAGMATMQENGGIARDIDNESGTSVDTMDSTPTYGCQLWYNPPVDGLRFGVSLTYMSDFGFTSSGTQEIPIPVAPNVYMDFPGAVSTHTVGNVLIQQYSAEYLWRNWTFQAEYYTYDYTAYSYTHIYVPAIQHTIYAAPPTQDNPATWYVAASRRFNKYVELGTYYTMYQDMGQKQNDATLSLRLDLRDWWIFKVEGHYIEGTGLLRDNADNPHQSQNSGWFMLAVKTTVSF